MARMMTWTITLASRRLPPAMILSPALISSSSRSLHSDFLHSLRITLPRNRRTCSVSPAGGFVASMKRSSKPNRRKSGARKIAAQNEEPELVVNICVEEELPDDPEVMSAAELLRHDVAVAMKAAFGFLGSEYKTRDTSIDNLQKFDKAEVSVTLCDDNFIRKLNKEWRDEDKATDVLSMCQHIPELNLPILLLGDLVISVETAARQAEERGHTLLDEIRILVVHGLLHLLGFDHEIGDEAEREMEYAEELILKNLIWKGKGLIKSAHDEPSDTQDDAPIETSKKDGVRRILKPKFRYIFCDMDGTLLNSKSRISPRNVEALKEASARGVNIIIATGKTRPAVLSVLKKANLGGKDMISSEATPGVFLQGLLIYGRQGREISRRNLDQNVCREAFLYSLERRIPLVAFSQDRCFSPFDDPLIESLHSVYHEPRAEVAPSIDDLLSVAEIQKLLFFDTPEGISNTLRPHWSKATKGRAGVVQAQADMLEIVPPQTSKGAGVRMLLDHLNVHPEEIMAIGDGENDVEMLQLASFSVALKNGCEKAKSVAHVVGPTNDEDGVADAIYKNREKNVNLEQENRLQG